MSFRLAAGGGAHAAGERLRGAARGPPPPNPAAARAIAPREGLDISSPVSSLRVGFTRFFFFFFMARA